MAAETPRFNERKATQLASRLLQYVEGRPYNRLALIKLIYLVDRMAFDRRGMAVSTDVYYSLPHGPIVSEILNLAKGESGREEGFWSQHIRPSGQYDVVLAEATAYDDLSEFEMNLADEVFGQYGSLTWQEIRDLSHDLPEYVEPSEDECGERRVRLSVGDILRAMKKTDDEIERAQENLKAQAVLDSLK